MWYTSVGISSYLVGLSRQPKQAKAFYAAIALATLVGAIANVLKVSPIKALIWSAVLNALAAAPIMVLFILSLI